MSMSPLAQEFCRRALTDRDAFWTEQSNAIHWEHPFEQVCDFSHPPFSRWFVGGRTNLCYNAVDRHLPARAAQPALYFISTEVEAERTFTFQELHAEVNTFAAVLRLLGLRRGEPAVTRFPIVPEALFVMVACVRVCVIASLRYCRVNPAGF